MAKRFTDTGKWDRAWFRKLSPELKCIWNFLCDRCDHAGVWEIDWDAMCFFVGIQTVPDLSIFGEKVTRIDAKRLLVNSFVDFQYGTLNPENRVHKSVLNRLEKLAPNKPLARTLKGSKDKDKEKDKDKDSFEEGSGEKLLNTDLESIYRTYPRKEGKSPGMKTAKAQIKTQADLNDLKTAIENYKVYAKAKGRSGDFLLMWSSFMSQWRDWIDPSHGQSENFSNATGIDYAARERAIFEGAS